MSTRARFLFVVAVAFSISMFAIGCGGSETPAAPETAEQPAGAPAPTTEPGEPAAAPAETDPGSSGLGSNPRREEREARFGARATDAPAAAAESEADEMAEPPEQESKSDASEPTAQANPAADPTAPLTAETIVGTKWTAGGMVLAFEPDGVLKLNDTMDGKWSIDGDKLTVEAMGSSYVADITGNSISYEGTTLERIP